MVKPKGWRPLNDAEKQEIVTRYSAGEAILDLVEAYHRDKKTIRTILLAAGVTIRPTGYPKGTVWSDAHREAHKRATSTPEFAEKSRQALLKRLPDMRGPATNTPIERRLHGALMKAGIGFATQPLLLDRYRVDIELSQARIVIEADGAQHTLRDQKAKDTERDAVLTEAGYRVFRFTGSVINRDAAECIRSVIDVCGLVPDAEPVYDIRTNFAGPAHPLWKGGKREFTCEQCGEKFLAQPSHRKGPHVYCSRQCAGAAKRGKKHTAGTRAKVSEALTRRKGEKRKPLTAEHRAKVSAALTGKPKTPEHVANAAAALRARNAVRSRESPACAETRRERQK